MQGNEQTTKGIDEHRHVRQVLEELARQREDLVALLIQSPVPICVLQGPDLIYEMANAAYVEVMGGREVVGKPLLDALPEFRGQGFDEILRGVMRAGQPVVGRDAVLMIDREGRLQESYWNFIYSPLRDADGSVNRVVALCEDVTEQRRLMNELIVADRRKDEFLAMLAHELRNPLAPLRTAVQILRLNASPAPGAERAIAIIDRQLRQLVHLVDDLLDVSRLTLDRLELRPASVDLATVVQAAVEASQPLIEEAGHHLSIVLPREPIELDADVTRLAQVFQNLLNNAAKYTEAGGQISLVAEPKGQEVVVRVRDSGVGIAPDLLPKIFDMFTQANPSHYRQGGLGIGLALVRRLVELHGGTVEAHSEGPGTGSEFVVRLPVATPPATAPPLHDPPAGPVLLAARHRILLVDDNRDAVEMSATMLEIMGHEVHAVYDGVEAVAAAETFRPDVALLDIGLPGRDGYEVAREIRTQAWGREMVLIAVTGWGQEEDQRRSREAGFDHHLVKPVDPEELLKLLNSLVRPSPAR